MGVVKKAIAIGVGAYVAKKVVDTEKGATPDDRLGTAAIMAGTTAGVAAYGIMGGFSDDDKKSNQKKLEKKKKGS